MTTICPLCQKSTSSTYFGHFRGGGICQECYDYLESVFQIIALQKISRAIEYLVSLADKEKEGE